MPDCIILSHLRRYPLMEIQDIFKLLFQRCFGGDHLIVDKDVFSERLTQEFNEINPSEEPLIEDIGNGYCRLSLKACKLLKIDTHLIKKAFFLSADKNKSMDMFYKEAQKIKTLCENGTLSFLAQDVDRFIDRWKESGCRPVSHSETYRNNYSPSYRVIKKKYAQCISVLAQNNRDYKNTIIAIDGNCGSGKSTLAQSFSELTQCNVIHADDFFLPMQKRTAERLDEPGGNFDYERFQDEIVKGLKSKKAFTYTPFVCRTKDFGSPVTITPEKITVVEGSYCMHPYIDDIYTEKIFVEADYNTQVDRIRKRNGEECLKNFVSKWIPMENKYFNTYGIKDKCNFVFKT